MIRTIIDRTKIGDGIPILTRNKGPITMGQRSQDHGRQQKADTEKRIEMATRAHPGREKASIISSVHNLKSVKQALEGRPSPKRMETR